MKKNTSEAFLVGLALLIFSTAAPAFAQGMPEEVSGTYTTPDGGTTIAFPDGWSGFEFSMEGIQMASVLPGGVEGGGDAQKAIMLIVADKTEADPTDPSSFSPSDDAPECGTPPTPTETTVSGKRGFEMTMECTNDEGETLKIKMTIAETSDSWIAVMYTSPLAEYEADVGKYDTAVDSLQIQGAIDATVPTMPSDGGDDTGDEEMETSDMPVMVGDESINVGVQSASTISEFALDEASKTLSFNADGSGTETVVMVGTVLEGPYTVMVDGQATQAEEGEDGTITVPHSSGSHEITITGTQVVPEFPFAAAGIAAGLIGIVAVIGRTKLIKGRI